ncbi:unnamed protein product [Calicophoron daubneyi]|uniref:Uncharacterized protein n=1 Tax=Calicophoron daubneyi TaxID=300641 RepID=A0AAV2TY13_CALDB
MKKKTRRSNKTSVSNNSGEIDLNLKREDREQPPVSSHAKSDNECTTEVFPSGNVEYDTSSTTSSREMGYPEDVIPCKQVTEAETDLVCSCVESAALSPNDFNSVLSNSRQEKNIHTNSIPDPAQVAGVTETKSDACGTPERTSFVTPRTASQVSTTAAPGSPVLDATERVFPLPDVNKELVQVEHLSPDDDAIKRNPELERLRKQLEVMASRLLTTQNQVDQLLEEKRVWIDTTSSLSSERRQNPGVGGELRGRWLQAKNQAETYKREKENMVIKYAQSEQKRLNLESRLKQLEMKLSKQATADKPGEFVDQVKSGSNGGPTALSKQSSDEQDFRDRLLQTEKSLSEAREQIESLTKGRTSDAVRIGTLESKLMISQDTLRSEQRKSAAQLENIARLNRSLEAAIKQAKDADRLREREAERLCTELAYKEAQEKIRRITGENKELREQISSLEPLKSQLEQSEKRAAELTVENGCLRDLQEEVEAGKLREDHLSEFARRLTERNANLQSEHLVTLTRLEEAERKLKEHEEFTSKSVSETSETLSERMIQIEDLKEQLECFRQKSENDTNLLES